MRIPRDCNANLVTELLHDFHACVAQVSQIFAKNIQEPVTRLSHDSRTTFLRASGTFCHKILANLQCDNFATLVRMLYDSHTTVLRNHANNLRLSYENIKLKDIHANVV